MKKRKKSFRDPWNLKKKQMRENNIRTKKKKKKNEGSETHDSDLIIWSLGNRRTQRRRRDSAVERTCRC